MTAARLVVQNSRQSIRRGDLDALGHDYFAVCFRRMANAWIEWVVAQGAPLIGAQS